MTMTQSQTMTLKEITDLLEVRHDKSMLKVEEMAKEPKFGQVSILDISYEKGNGALGITQTYQLDKRQSIAVAAKLNTSLLMRIIDRWQELEQVTQTLADKAGVPKEVLIKDAKDDALLAKLKASIDASKAKSELSKLKVEAAKERDALKLKAAKEKYAEQSKVLHARTTKLLSQGALVKGNMIASKLDLPTDTITNLLKEHGSDIEPKLANWALRQLGYLTKTHEVTDTGHYYGRNIKSSPRSKTTLARWFPSEFPELLDQIESTIEDLVNN